MDAASANKIRKWAGYIPEGSEHALQIALFLDNQRTYNSQLGVVARSTLASQIGKEWDEVLLHAIARALSQDPIFRLFGVQTMPGVDGKVFYLTPTDIGGDAETNYKADNCRALAGVEQIPQARIAASSPLGDDKPRVFVISLVQSVFARALTLIREGVVKKAHLAAPPCAAVGGTLARVETAMKKVHDDGGRGAANRLIGVKKHWNELTSLEDRAEYCFDPRFVAHQVLVHHQGENVMDTGVVWAPVCFTFKTAEIEKRGGEPGEKKHVVDVGICHSTHVVRRELLAVVNV